MTLSASLSIVMGLSRTQRVIYLYFLCFFPTAGRKAVLWQPDIFSPHPKNLQSQGRWVNSRSVCSFSLFQEAVEVNLRKVACKCTHTCTHTCTRARAHTHTHTHTHTHYARTHTQPLTFLSSLPYAAFYTVSCCSCNIFLVGWMAEWNTTFSADIKACLQHSKLLIQPFVSPATFQFNPGCLAW